MLKSYMINNLSILKQTTMEYDFFTETMITSTCILVMSLLFFITVSWIRISERKENAANGNKRLERKKTLGSRIYKEIRGVLGSVIVLLIIINKGQVNIVTHVLIAIVVAFDVYDVYRGVVTHNEKKKVWGLFSIVCMALIYILAAYARCLRSY